MFENEPWLKFLEPVQRELLTTSFDLLAWAKQKGDKYHDFSFIVMPAAKAFEGYMKKWLFTLKFIGEEDYSHDRFRLGKALNPELEQKHPEQCLFNEISRRCSPSIAQELWETWKRCRNRLLHYFPAEQQVFTLQESEDRLGQIVKTIQESFRYINK